MTITFNPPEVLQIVCDITDHEGKSAVLTTWKSYPANPTQTLENLAQFLGDWGNAVANATNGAVRRVSATLAVTGVLTYPDIPAGAWYPNIEDKLRCSFQSEEGAQQYVMKIPAPSNGLFLSDQETINPAGAEWIALLSYLNADFTTHSAQPNMHLQAGILDRAKPRRRLRPGVWTEVGG